MSLIEDAKAAKKAGLSYGQYMLHKPFEPYKKPTGLRCANCGGPLYGAQRRFCCLECREASKARTRAGDLFV